MKMIASETRNLVNRIFKCYNEKVHIYFVPQSLQEDIIILARKLYKKQKGEKN